MIDFSNNVSDVFYVSVHTNAEFKTLNQVSQLCVLLLTAKVKLMNLPCNEFRIVSVISEKIMIRSEKRNSMMSSY